jgi:hypothetical protein
MPCQNPTARWVFFCFPGIHILTTINPQCRGKEIVLSLIVWGVFIRGFIPENDAECWINAAEN